MRSYALIRVVGGVGLRKSNKERYFRLKQERHLQRERERQIIFDKLYISNSQRHTNHFLLLKYSFLVQPLVIHKMKNTYILYV